MPERKRLVAGNWKMNGSRADGLALARGVAERARAAAWLRSAGLSAVHAARGSRGGPRRQRRRARRPGLPSRAVGRLYRLHQRRDAEGCRLQPCHRRPFRAAPHLRRDRRRRAGEDRSRLARRAGRDRLRRRDPRRARGRPGARGRLGADRRLDPRRRRCRQSDRRLRAGLGDRHRADPDHRPTSPKSTPRSAASCRPGRASCTAARSIRKTPPKSWRWKRSTARWSAAPA